MAAKLTPWFPSNVKPARPGVYQTAFGSSACAGSLGGYSFWTGTRWSNQRGRPEKARRNDLGGASQDKRWRGLAQQPKGGAL